MISSNWVRKEIGEWQSCWWGMSIPGRGSDRTAVQKWLIANMIVVRFVYGLSFFTMGLVVSLQRQQKSRYTLAQGLWSLAAFAFLHAFADWGLVFIPLRGAPPQSPAVVALWGLRTMLGALSFGFLLQFGVTLLSVRRTGFWRLARTVAAPSLTVLWTLAFFAYPLVNQGAGVRGWYLASEVWARYLLGLPASVLVAAALLAQRGELRRDRLHAQLRSLYASAGFFALYGVVGGIIVPPQGFWPASVLNTETFLRTIGLPVELFRAAAATGTALYTSRLMAIFTIETTRRLYRAEEEQAIFRDRERIAQDLHDGLLQTLYGIGLSLQYVRDQLPDDAHSLRRVLAEASDQLGAAVIDLRQSILDLRRSDVKISSLVPAVRRVAEQFARLARLSVELEIEGLDESEVGDRTLPASCREHLLALVREGLSNAARHSGAGAARVMLALEDDTFILRITDQGVGFNPQAYLRGDADGRGAHYGLRNMKSRTEQMGGAFRVDSAPGQGTRLLFQIPIPPSSGGAQTDEQANAPGSGGR